MAEKVMAFDDGFGDNKLFNGKDEYIIPSFVTRWQPIPQEDLSNVDTIDPFSHITVEYDGYKFLVGEAARQLDTKGDWVSEENKHYSSKFIPILKAQLAILAKNEMDRELTLNPLVMGLSVDHDTEERRQHLAKLMKGTHEVKVTLADGSVIDKIIHVESLVVTKQPFGSFAYVALDDKGQFKDELIKKQTTVVVDLGARTLNVLTLRGFTVLDALSFNNNNGMIAAWTDIRQQIIDDHTKTIPLARIPNYCLDGYISNGVSIETIRDSNYALHADTVCSSIGSLFIDNKDEVDRIILTGGGVEILRDLMYQGMKLRFPQAKIETLGRTATSKGYYNFGVRTQRFNNAKKAQQQKNQAPAKKEQPVEQ